MNNIRAENISHSLHTPINQRQVYPSMRITPEADRRLIDTLFARYRQIKEQQKQTSLSAAYWYTQMLHDEEMYLRRQLYERGYDPDEC